MFNQEVRFPLLTHLTLGTPFGDVDFPEIQAGLFTDVGQARFSTTVDRALLGSYGVSFRMALGPLDRAAPRRRPPLQQRPVSRLRPQLGPEETRVRQLLLRL